MLEQSMIIELSRAVRSPLDRAQSPCDVSDLLGEELIDFQPVLGVGVREQMVDHVIDPKMGKSQRGMVVVEFQGGDACRVGLEAQD